MCSLFTSFKCVLSSADLQRNLLISSVWLNSLAIVGEYLEPSLSLGLFCLQTDVVLFEALAESGSQYYCKHYYYNVG